MELTYFNPNSQKEPDFLKGFVARQRTLDFFLKQLRLVPTSGAAQHYLIIAPRGFGKTSLLRRIAIGVQTDEQLKAKFIALRFREEQHNVISLDVFWRNCLQSLAEAREDEGAAEDEIAELDAAWVTYAPRQALSQEAQDGEPAWQVLHAHCERLGRRPLLLIDNLDTLLAGLSPHHQWGLRKRLQSDDGPVLIAAASRYPAATHDQAAAFYEFFRVQPLEKLSDDEVFACLRNLAVHRGPAGQAVLTLLDKDPGRVAALNAMAGGNPRTLSVLYGVLESDRSADMLSQLNAMLDTFTGWYQARAEELPMQARAVFDALALNWDPMTAAALGRVTGLDTPVVSSQLARLEKSGYVDAVALNSRGKGRSGYQVSERFFNIWYLMRNGPRRARQSIFFLTKFLQSCFSTAERRLHAVSVLEDGRSDPAYTLALASSFRAGRLRQQLLEQAYIRSHDSGLGGEYEPLINELRSEGQRQAGVVSRSPRTDEQLIRDCDDIIVRFGTATEPAARELVAQALVNKGVMLDSIGKSEQAIIAYEEVVARFSTATEPALCEPLARALIYKGGMLGATGQSEQEIAVYDDVVGRFGSATAPALREQVARALFNKGVRLGAVGQSEQAIAAYDDVVGRFSAAIESPLRELVAMALVNKGFRLGAIGQSEQAIKVHDDVLARFGAATEPALRGAVARALVDKGFRLAAIAQPEQAIAVYDDLITRFGASLEPVVRELVAIALINKAVGLGSIGQQEQAIAACDDVVSRYVAATEPALREQVAKALFNKGLGLGAIGKPEQEIAAYDDLVARFGTAPELALREKVGMALVNKGVMLGVIAQPEQAIAAYDDVVARFGSATEPVLREPVAFALVNKGVMLGIIGKPEQAIAVYDDVVVRYGMVNEAPLHELVARAFGGKARLLRELERYDISKSAYCDAIKWDPTISAFHIDLGNLLLDFVGEISNALAVFQSGLDLVTDLKGRVLLHANIAYAIALHDGDRFVARMHANSALEDGTEISPAGRRLLEALPIWNEHTDPDWPHVFEHIGKALSSEDAALWTDYVDDMERVLWFVITKGQGSNFKRWMEDAQFSNRYAPLYHAFVAALEGEDHLLQINPETRQPAQKIYSGIARRAKLWSSEKRN